jgi:hypothetical protein
VAVAGLQLTRRDNIAESAEPAPIRAWLAPPSGLIVALVILEMTTVESRRKPAFANRRFFSGNPCGQLGRPLTRPAPNAALVWWEERVVCAQVEEMPAVSAVPSCDRSMCSAC